MKRSSAPAAHAPPPDRTSEPSPDSSAHAASKPIDIAALSRAKRTLSGSSEASSTNSHSLLSSPSSSLRKTSSSWVKPAPTVNVHTTCGRHTDQFFFSGPSLAELARSVMKKP